MEGASPNDVTQGILGNCWFVSACSALTHNQRLLNKVISIAFFRLLRNAVLSVLLSTTSELKLSTLSDDDGKMLKNYLKLS